MADIKYIFPEYIEEEVKDSPYASLIMLWENNLAARKEVVNTTSEMI